MNKNEWDSVVSDNDSNNGPLLDELTEVQKAQIANYVHVAVNGYAKEDRQRIALLEKNVQILGNAVNALLVCLENGIPVKNGKVVLDGDGIRQLTAPKAVN